MPSIQEYAAVCFGEADKSSKKEFEKDCVASMWVLKNRVNDPNPNRYPNPIEGFTSVGGSEWKKFMSGTLTKEEEWFAKKAYQLSGAIERGLIDDTTSGANHIYNFKLDKPNAWNVRWEEKDAPLYQMYYPETYKTKAHSYRKETLRTRRRIKKTVNPKRK